MKTYLAQMFAEPYHIQNSMLCNKNVEPKAWNLKEKKQNQDKIEETSYTNDIKKKIT